MRIGLVRHFAVDCSHNWLLSATEFEEWVQRYDCSPIHKGDLRADESAWDRCYCSDLQRTVETAQSIYKGNIQPSALIREVPMAPIMNSSIKLPYGFWLIAGRLAWRYAHSSQPESSLQTKERVQKFITSIAEDKNTLVVTHGFVMLELQAQLFAQGFVGECFTRAKHGKIYVFEKNN